MINCNFDDHIERKNGISLILFVKIPESGVRKTLRVSYIEEKLVLTVPYLNSC